ncbi:MAG: hypothetical protein IVW53_11450 [Chloroflexi bacterium]|nr:hypothetical protein [Chloroflexota bacterium]
MAVYHGARPRTGFAGTRIGIRRDAVAPAASIAPPTALPRRRTRSAVRAGTRPARIGFVLGGIVVAFLLAFFSLAQSVRVSARSYDLASLQTDRQRMEATLQDLATNINRLGSAPAIRKQAIDAGLSQLAAPLVVAAR